jgi:ribosome-associated translation inhibitor RaiA
MTIIQAVSMRSHGDVPEGARELAVSKVRSVLQHVAKPVLSARITLTMSADPAMGFPAVAHVTIDLNGQTVAAGAAGRTMPGAIERMADRLRTRLDRVVHSPVSRQQAARERHPRQQLAKVRRDGGWVGAVGPSPLATRLQCR